MWCLSSNTWVSWGSQKVAVFYCLLFESGFKWDKRSFEAIQSACLMLFDCPTLQILKCVSHLFQLIWASWCIAAVQKTHFRHFLRRMQSPKIHSVSVCMCLHLLKKENMAICVCFMDFPWWLLRSLDPQHQCRNGIGELRLVFCLWRWRFSHYWSLTCLF